MFVFFLFMSISKVRILSLRNTSRMLHALHLQLLFFFKMNVLTIQSELPACICMWLWQYCCIAVRRCNFSTAVSECQKHSGAEQDEVPNRYCRQYWLIYYLWVLHTASHSLSFSALALSLPSVAQAPQCGNWREVLCLATITMVLYTLARLENRVEIYFKC